MHSVIQVKVRNARMLTSKETWWSSFAKVHITWPLECCDSTWYRLPGWTPSCRVTLSFTVCIDSGKLRAFRWFVIRSLMRRGMWLGPNGREWLIRRNECGVTFKGWRCIKFDIINLVVYPSPEHFSVPVSALRRSHYAPISSWDV